MSGAESQGRGGEDDGENHRPTFTIFVDDVPARVRRSVAVGGDIKAHFGAPHGHLILLDNGDDRPVDDLAEVRIVHNMRFRIQRIE